MADEAPSHPLIAAWIARLRDGERRSPHTLRAYGRTGERFLAFLSEHHGEAVDRSTLQQLGQADLRAYLAFRRAQGLSNNSTARELSAIRKLLRFASDDGISAGPRVKGPKVKRGVPRPAAPDDIAALGETARSNAKQPWVGARDWAVLMLLYGAGLRISEALGLTGGVLPLGETLRVTGKRDKTRIVPLLPQVRAAIEDYIALCPYAIRADTPRCDKDSLRDAPLFRGARGGPLSPAIVRAVVRQARRSLGLTETLTPHALRHSFASHLLAGGADLRSLQELLGHASLSSTQVYTAVDVAHLLDVYDNAHPRA